MTALNSAIDPRTMNERIKALPRDPRGFPVPWFVHIGKDKVADFRIIGAAKVEYAIGANLCWICGHALPRDKAFNIGPMCTINRVSAEPPSHRSCAVFAAMNCPFLTKPRMRRNTKDLPEGHMPPVGKPVMHNPGATCVWVTQEFRVMPVDNGVLFRIGEPIDVRWFCHGKTATRDEVVKAIGKGLPILIDEAKQEGEDAVRALLQAVQRMRQYLPAHESEDKNNDARQGAPPEEDSPSRPRATSRAR